MVTLDRCAAVLETNNIHLNKTDLNEFRAFLYQLAYLQVEDYNNKTNNDTI